MYQHIFKIVIIGNTGVGKSCLLLRFTDNNFTDAFISTIGVDFRMTTIKLGETAIKLQIWDTAGQERFRTITSAYYRNSVGIIIVYDVTQRSSFEEVAMWFAEANKFCKPPVVYYLVANKCDVASRVVTEEEGRSLAASLGIKYVEASAKTAENVERLFTDLTTDMLTNIKVEQTDSIALGGAEPKDRTRCC